MTQDYFFIKNGSTYIRIDYRHLLYIMAAENYTKLFTTQGMHLANISMIQWQKELPAGLFCKVHKTYIVSLANILIIDKAGIHLGETVIPIGLRYRHSLLEKIKVIQKSFKGRLDTKELILVQNGS